MDIGEASGKIGNKAQQYWNILVVKCRYCTASPTGHLLGEYFSIVTKCIVYFLGHDFSAFFSVVPYPFWFGESFMAFTYKVSKLAPWAQRVLFPPVSLQKQAVLSCCLGTHVSVSGESLHCFLVGVNKMLYQLLTCASSFILRVWFRGEPTLFPGWCK